MRAVVVVPRGEEDPASRNIEKKKVDRIDQEGSEAGGDDDFDPNFEYSHGLTSHEADALLKQYGLNVLPEKVTPKWKILLNQVTQVCVCA